MKWAQPVKSSFAAAVPADELWEGTEHRDLEKIWFARSSKVRGANVLSVVTGAGRGPRPCQEHVANSVAAHVPTNLPNHPGRQPWQGSFPPSLKWGNRFSERNPLARRHTSS